MFKIGQKVVCVEGYTLITTGVRIIKNEIYTVSAIQDCNCFQNISVGIKDGFGTRCSCCGKSFGNDECFHRASRFRPIDYTFGENLAEEIQEEINQEQLIEHV